MILSPRRVRARAGARGIKAGQASCEAMAWRPEENGSLSSTGFCVRARRVVEVASIRCRLDREEFIATLVHPAPVNMRGPRSDSRVRDHGRAHVVQAPPRPGPVIRSSDTSSACSASGPESDPDKQAGFGCSSRAERALAIRAQGVGFVARARRNRVSPSCVMAVRTPSRAFTPRSMTVPQRCTCGARGSHRPLEPRRKLLLES